MNKPTLESIKGATPAFKHLWYSMRPESSIIEPIIGDFEAGNKIGTTPFYIGYPIKSDNSGVCDARRSRNKAGNDNV